MTETAARCARKARSKAVKVKVKGRLTNKDDETKGKKTNKITKWLDGNHEMAYITHMEGRGARPARPETAVSRSYYDLHRFECEYVG